MANVKLNPTLVSIQGQIGDIVFRMRYGKMYSSRKPDYRRLVLSDASRAARTRFRDATQYMKTVLSAPDSRAPYVKAAKAKNTSVQGLIMADFLKSPSVDEIDLLGYDGRPGSTMKISAHDDFEVTGVDVALFGDSGEKIERGNAVLIAQRRHHWVYTATAAVPAGTRVRVEVIASDRPGNKATRSQVFNVAAATG